jgi:hypothetical protein
VSAYKPPQVAKAVAAACTAAVGTLITGVADDGLSGTELVIVVLSTLAAAAAVFATPNAPTQ